MSFTRFPYLPHSEKDIREMLSTIGVDSIEELFCDIPKDVALERKLNLQDHASEPEVFQRLSDLSSQNVDAISYLGAGCYDHLIPSVVSFITSRSEFLTAYTPYQAEASQGILQAMFEYQTLVCQLTGLDVSNASLYDGATATAEGCSMAINSVRNSDTILYSSTIYPSTVAVLKTFFSDISVTLECVDASNGTLTIKDIEPHLRAGVAALVVQSPNMFGCIEDYAGVSEALGQFGSLLILSVNPISLAILRSPRDWGVDIAVGSGQPCGMAPYFGGPSVGFMAVREPLVRKLPGRIIGETVDANGERAYVLTLQAREQHIKRERATSNICTNQALAALSMAVYLVSVGPVGLRDVAEQNVQKSHYLYDRIIEIGRIRPLFPNPFFNEFAIELNKPAKTVMDDMLQEGFLAGVPLDGEYSGHGQGLLIAVTEKRTRNELDNFARALERVLS